eukprot:s2373_g3.t1
MAAPPPATPPDAIPEDLKEDVGKLTKGLSVILVARQIPWHVQAAMGRQGYITVEDLADRWDTPEAARQNGPTDLGFLAGTHGFDQATTAFTAMRLLQAVRTARQTSSLPGALGGPASPGKSTSAASSPLEANLDRSDALLKRQFKFVNRGELGFIPVKYLVSALPEEGERPTKTTKRFTLDGWEGHEEEEIRANPTTRRQLERMHMVFRTTLLMCLASVPQFGNLALTKRELDDWYNWFYAKDIAGRHPAPSEAILLYAERNAWRRIHDLVHGGETLSQALKTIRQDLLFWTGGRPDSLAWGLDALSPTDQEDVDNDSTLLLRQMYLTSLAYSAMAQRPQQDLCGSFLEHPSDPVEVSTSPAAHQCSSVWHTQVYKQWAHSLHHHRIKLINVAWGKWP